MAGVEAPAGVVFVELRDELQELVAVPGRLHGLFLDRLNNPSCYISVGWDRATLWLSLPFEICPGVSHVHVRAYGRDSKAAEGLRVQEAVLLIPPLQRIPVVGEGLHLRESRRVAAQVHIPLGIVRDAAADPAAALTVKDLVDPPQLCPRIVRQL